ncbi:MAG: hypothetical protein U0900_23635 [Myxococcota bacterium]
MTRRSAIALGLRVALGLGVVLALAGCATRPGDVEPLPQHPFPRWVGELEVGKSDAGSVRERFGEPDAIEQSVRGGLVYRYRFAETHWPDDDPDRPVVGADGKLWRRPNTKAEDVGAEISAFGEWLDWLLFYPPKQSRPPRRRSLPATIHDLELAFDLEGKLVRYRYAPREGLAPIRPRG